MEYRTLPHGGEKISVIGLGSAGLHNASDAEVERTIDEAVDAGVNHFDFIPSESRPLAAMGRALRRHRADGTIRHLAFSTHSPHIARRLIATGAFDLAMFSLNPMYDYTDESAYGKGEVADRMELLLATSWRRSTTATSSTMRGSAWGTATATVAAPLAWRSPRACARLPRILACDAGEKGQAERARAYVRRLSRNRLAAREVVAVRFQTTSMMETAGG